MTFQKYYYIRKYLFIISVLFIFTGCDIIDAIINDDNTSTSDLFDDDWDYSAIIKYEIDYFIDNADYKITYKDGVTPIEYANGREHIGHFTSVAGEKLGSTVYFNCEAIIGQTICGVMTIDQIYSDGNFVGYKVVINQDKSWDSSIFGKVKQTYKVTYDYVPFDKSYTEDGLEVLESYESGSSVSKIILSYKEENDIYKEEIIDIHPGSRSYIKVRIYR